MQLSVFQDGHKQNVRDDVYGDCYLDVLGFI